MRRFFVIALALSCTVAFASTAHAAQDNTDLLYPAIGPAANAGFYVNSSVPQGVNQARFVAVVQRSLTRWGDRFLGFTNQAPLNDDGVNVIGFADLGGQPNGQGIGGQTGTSTHVVTTPGTPVCTTTQVPVTRTQTYYTTRRVKKRVRRRRNGRLKWVRIYVKVTVPVTRTYTEYVARQQCVPGQPTTTTTYEYDVRLNSRFTVWQLGPDYPNINQVDLESDLLHELGHVAGLSHASAPCPTSSPMAASSWAGDWWRSPSDYSVAYCKQANGIASRSATFGAPLRFSTR